MSPEERLIQWTKIVCALYAIWRIETVVHLLQIIAGR
jgi:hypothetical protein